MDVYLILTILKNTRRNSQPPGESSPKPPQPQAYTRRLLCRRTSIYLATRARLMGRALRRRESVEGGTKQKTKNKKQKTKNKKAKNKKQKTKNKKLNDLSRELANRSNQYR
jgi:hypothetical protein